MKVMKLFLRHNFYSAAVINKQIFEERIVSASHEAIEAWNMMAMTMNFSVSDDVDFNVLTPGTELHMEIKMGNSGMYEIIGTHIMSAGSMRSEEDKPSTEDLSDPNHDDMDHSKMDHGEMDHSNMDHSQMSHGEMDHTNHQQHADDGE